MADKSNSLELTDLQFKILDCLYFVEPFDRIVEEVGAPANFIAADIKWLIAKRWIQPMRYDELLKDYVKSFMHDSDDMRAFHYLATKEGLLKHNGR